VVWACVFRSFLFWASSAAACAASAETGRQKLSNCATVLKGEDFAASRRPRHGSRLRRRTAASWVGRAGTFFVPEFDKPIADLKGSTNLEPFSPVLLAYRANGWDAALRHYQRHARQRGIRPSSKQGEDEEPIGAAPFARRGLRRSEDYC